MRAVACGFLQGHDSVSKPQTAQDADDLSEFVSVCLSTWSNRLEQPIYQSLLQVQNLLQQMQGRFQTMSDSIISRVDAMGSKIDDLEKQIGDLVQQSGVEDKAQRQMTKRQSS